MNTTTANLVHFLMHNTNVRGKDSINLVYMKGNPLNAGTKRMMVPVYASRGADRNGTDTPARLGFPEDFKYSGVWIPHEMCFISQNAWENTMNAEGSGIDILSESNLCNKIRESIAGRIGDWIVENKDGIEAGNAFNEEKARHYYDRGYGLSDIPSVMDMEIKECTEIIQSLLQAREFNTAAWVVKDTTEEDGVFMEMRAVAEKDIAAAKALCGALREKLECRDMPPASKRSYHVRTVFKTLRDQGLKNCFATFDFGYCTVRGKVDMDLPHYTWLGGTMKATEEFTKNYIQPITMNFEFPDVDDFLAYVTRLEARGKTVYTAEPMEIIKENRLYNSILRCDSGKDFDPDDYDGDNPDCSLPFFDGRDALCIYVWRFYSSVRGVKFLVGHGADPGILARKIDYYDGLSGMHRSRDWQDIKEYILELEKGKDDSRPENVPAGETSV